ncbi:uncharacterized protein BXZ73DRAFT_79570 [Epithele typhae]|uniref:uncharacterized protein n=1 Tax=Epithele typhae TaxID=378194 RepID=UPI002007DA2E|nr:uncharacterized protein BXZ73DRAFT_79570 [Epithele typhae]KAH9923155.1 hypothetical protein BXZ73DRAFT_79570 [Epithele typhae]
MDDRRESRASHRYSSPHAVSSHRHRHNLNLREETRRSRRARDSEYYHDRHRLGYLRTRDNRERDPPTEPTTLTKRKYSSPVSDSEDRERSPGTSRVKGEDEADGDRFLQGFACAKKAKVDRRSDADQTRDTWDHSARVEPMNPLPPVLVYRGPNHLPVPSHVKDVVNKIHEHYESVSKQLCILPVDEATSSWIVRCRFCNYFSNVISVDGGSEKCIIKHLGKAHHVQAYALWKRSPTSSKIHALPPAPPAVVDVSPGFGLPAMTTPWDAEAARTRDAQQSYSPPSIQVYTTPPPTPLAHYTQSQHTHDSFSHDSSLDEAPTAMSPRVPISPHALTFSVRHFQAAASQSLGIPVSQTAHRAAQLSVAPSTDPRVRPNASASGPARTTRSVSSSEEASGSLAPAPQSSMALAQFSTYHEDDNTDVPPGETDQHSPSPVASQNPAATIERHPRVERAPQPAGSSAIADPASIPTPSTASTSTSQQSPSTSRSRSAATPPATAHPPTAAMDSLSRFCAEIGLGQDGAARAQLHMLGLTSEERIRGLGRTSRRTRDSLTRELEAVGLDWTARSLVIDGLARRACPKEGGLDWKLISPLLPSPTGPSASPVFYVEGRRKPPPLSPDTSAIALKSDLGISAVNMERRRSPPHSRKGRPSGSALETLEARRGCVLRGYGLRRLRLAEMSLNVFHESVRCIIYRGMANLIPPSHTIHTINKVLSQCNPTHGTMCLYCKFIVLPLSRELPRTGNLRRRRPCRFQIPGKPSEPPPPHRSKLPLNLLRTMPPSSPRKLRNFLSHRAPRRPHDSPFWSSRRSPILHPRPGPPASNAGDGPSFAQPTRAGFCLARIVSQRIRFHPRPHRQFQTYNKWSNFGSPSVSARGITSIPVPKTAAPSASASSAAAMTPSGAPPNTIPIPEPRSTVSSPDAPMTAAAAASTPERRAKREPTLSDYKPLTPAPSPSPELHPVRKSSGGSLTTSKETPPVTMPTSTSPARTTEGAPEPAQAIGSSPSSEPLAPAPPTASPAEIGLAADVAVVLRELGLTDDARIHALGGTFRRTRDGFVRQMTAAGLDWTARSLVMDGLARRAHG